MTVGGAVDTVRATGHALDVTVRRFRIVVCRGPDCGDRRGSAVVHAALVDAVHAAGVSDRCEFDWQCCFGRCSQGPNVLVREITGAPPPRVGLADLPPRLGGAARQATALYNRVTPAHAAELVAGHVVGGAVVRHLIETVPLRPTEPRPSSPRPDPTVPEVVREEVKVP